MDTHTHTWGQVTVRLLLCEEQEWPWGMGVRKVEPRGAGKGGDIWGDFTQITANIRASVMSLPRTESPKSFQVSSSLPQAPLGSAPTTVTDVLFV